MKKQKEVSVYTSKKKKQKETPLCAQVKRMLRKERVKVTSSRCFDTELVHQGENVRLVNITFRGYWSGKR